MASRSMRAPASSSAPPLGPPDPGSARGSTGAASAPAAGGYGTSVARPLDQPARTSAGCRGVNDVNFVNPAVDQPARTSAGCRGGHGGQPDTPFLVPLGTARLEGPPDRGMVNKPAARGAQHGASSVVRALLWRVSAVDGSLDAKLISLVYGPEQLEGRALIWRCFPSRFGSSRRWRRGSWWRAPPRRQRQRG